jgi:hypothetical protein
LVKATRRRTTRASPIVISFNYSKNVARALAQGLGMGWAIFFGPSGGR